MDDESGESTEPMEEMPKYGSALNCTYSYVSIKALKATDRGDRGKWCIKIKAV